MRIYLMRHCTTDQSGIPNHDQMEDVPLNRQGRSEARLAGRFLRDSGIKINLIISSTLERARQTASRIAKRVDAPVAFTDALLPQDISVPHDGQQERAERAWDAVEAILRDEGIDDRILIVSHGPLIQNIGDFLVGRPISTWHYGSHFIHGSIAKIEDGRFHWFVTPKLLARVRDEEDKLKEAALILNRLTETASRERRLNRLKPLEAKLATAVLRRMRQQGREALRALKAVLRDQRIEAGQAVPAAATAAVLSALAVKRAIRAYENITGAAYAAGGSEAADHLDYDGSPDTPGYGRTSDQLKQQLDATTAERVRDALAAGFGAESLSAAVILSLVASVFNDQDRAEMVAQYEVGQAFHSGMSDGARAISMDTGEDIEKRWDCEDDACDDCQDAADEDWVDLDYDYPQFGAGDPPGHPNCRCSLELRRAEG